MSSISATLPTRPVAAADGKGCSWSEDLIYNDDRIFARGPSDIKGRPGTNRGIIPYYSSFGPVENMSPQAVYLEKIGVHRAVLYSSSILAALLWCTIFIVYRILRVDGIAAGMRVYHRLVEMLVESAALHSAVIVVLEVRSEAAEIYMKEFAIAMRGIVPTILVGRIATGHARLDDSWSKSTATSLLQFRSS
ncbi:hypothetical protein ARMGADRAFT_1082759 [Armillaria gallica]|uniref:Uncharacterized protein n=1 Tax=Armillaria gallica TaxID=47427 RepID=A0A2H3D5H5_ARMGA|nr:hypothetical protein ARMGADRAFT_1082759 [Armillaria gallica]